jgi:hypothetical protein
MFIVGYYPGGNKCILILVLRVLKKQLLKIIQARNKAR